MANICKHGNIVGGMPPAPCAECVREALTKEIERLAVDLDQARAELREAHQDRVDEAERAESAEAKNAFLTQELEQLRAAYARAVETWNNVKLNDDYAIADLDAFHAFQEALSSIPSKVQAVVDVLEAADDVLDACQTAYGYISDPQAAGYVMDRMKKYEAVRKLEAKE